tara:strand:+ start:824 stop:1123 length:300 start_codon:yes stop_codon:yes gene_type:complete
MDATTLVTIITMFIVTDTSSEFVKYDGLMDCLKEKRRIEKLKDGRRVICGPSLAEIDADGKIVSIKNKMPDQSGSLKLGGTAKSLSEKKKEKKIKVLTQ